MSHSSYFTRTESTGMVCSWLLGCFFSLPTARKNLNKFAQRIKVERNKGRNKASLIHMLPMAINGLVGVWDTSKQPTGLLFARGLISWLSPKCLSYHYQLERRANLLKGQSQPPKNPLAINSHAILLLWKGKHIPSGS